MSVPNFRKSYHTVLGAAIDSHCRRIIIIPTNIAASSDADSSKDCETRGKCIFFTICHRIEKSMLKTYQWDIQFEMQLENAFPEGNTSAWTAKVKKGGRKERVKGKKKGQKSKRRKHNTSQDSQFNLFIRFSVDTSRTVWMCVCEEGLGVCVVSRREWEMIYKSATKYYIVQRIPQHTKCAQVIQYKINHTMCHIIITVQHSLSLHRQYISIQP